MPGDRRFARGERRDAIAQALCERASLGRAVLNPRDRMDILVGDGARLSVLFVGRSRQDYTSSSRNDLVASA